MTHKSKIILLSVTGVLPVLLAAFWFFVLLPNQEYQAKQAQEALASGIQLFEGKKYDQALETFSLVPTGTDQEAKARYYQGSAHMMLKNFESAVNYLEQAHRLDSQDVGVLYALGVAYFKLGNVKLAKSYFASVVEINPNDEQAKGLLDIMARLERNASEQSEAGLNNN